MTHAPRARQRKGKILGKQLNNELLVAKSREARSAAAAADIIQKAGNADGTETHKQRLLEANLRIKP
jgi:hypothetical protein